ncbi:hypothetical protein OPV22_005756 [Ensete ventricosum]|uniref:Uncharacterized protein n=1 Tax=Ensete ventricosum TaxID=4639 RepID=A0AAV8RS65_ENSVE|nr:hypothetical protein OPV22_005756 [Ensete ventricosum]
MNSICTCQQIIIPAIYVKGSNLDSMIIIETTMTWRDEGMDDPIIFFFRHDVLEHGGHMSHSKRNAALTSVFTSYIQIPTSFRYWQNEQEHHRGRGCGFCSDPFVNQLSMGIQANLETALTSVSEAPSTTPLSLSQSNRTTPILEEFPPLGDRDSRELPMDVLKLLAKALEKLSILRRNHFLLCLSNLLKTLKQNVADGGNSKQRKKTSNFHRVLPGDGAAAAPLDLSRTDSPEHMETGRPLEGPLVGGAWRGGSWNKPFETSKRNARR